MATRGTDDYGGGTAEGDFDDGRVHDGEWKVRMTSAENCTAVADSSNDRWLRVDRQSVQLALDDMILQRYLSFMRA